MFKIAEGWNRDDDKDSPVLKLSVLTNPLLPKGDLTKILKIYIRPLKTMYDQDILVEPSYNIVNWTNQLCIDLTGTVGLISATACFTYALRSCLAYMAKRISKHISAIN